MTGLVTVSARDASASSISSLAQQHYGVHVASAPLSLIATGYAPLKRGEKPTVNTLFLHVGQSTRAPFTKKPHEIGHPDEGETLLRLGEFISYACGIRSIPVIAYDNPAPGHRKMTRVIRELEERWSPNSIEARIFVMRARQSGLGVVQVYHMPATPILDEILARVNTSAVKQ